MGNVDVRETFVLGFKPWFIYFRYVQHRFQIGFCLWELQQMDAVEKSCQNCPYVWEFICSSNINLFS